MKSNATMKACYAAVLLIAVIPFATGQTKPTTPTTPGANASTADTQAKTADTTAARVCTALPDSVAAATPSKSDAAAKSGGNSTGASSQNPAVQVTVNPAATAANPGKKSGTGDTPQSTASTSTFISLDAGMTNAVEIAPNLKSANPNVLSATAVNPSQIAIVLAFPQKNPKVTEKDLKNFARPFERANPDVFAITLPAGTGKACDVAHALVNTAPGITSITAVDDTRLLVTVQPANPAVSALLKNLAIALATPAVPTAPKVETIVQRLYYIHDPAAVAALINNAYPNVQAQAMSPDMVVLSDAADLDEGAQQAALQSARRTITRLDQPHPQVSIDAWTLQLATTDRKKLGEVVPSLEDFAGEYNAVIGKSIGGGWKYLAQQLKDPANLDLLMRQYLTSTTRVPMNGHVERLEQPYSQGQASSKSEGYGLGFETLYYPLTPNLIDMLIALSSMKNPTDAATQTLKAMQREDKNANPEHKSSPPQPCRESDEYYYNFSNISGQHAGFSLRRSSQDSVHNSLEYIRKKVIPDSPPPNTLRLECLSDALIGKGGLFADSGDGMATSSIGQLRAALADFLFHYKLLVQYPDEFHPFLEPMAADTLDSAFAPVVSAFDADLSVFQEQLQRQIASRLEHTPGIQYGYGGLVSVKVLGNQLGAVTTATQNYFDATPAPTLNDLFTNLQAEGASVNSSPLSSLVTSLAPAKAVELLTVLGQTLAPKPTTAHLGRGLDLVVTAHTLSGAYGAELDLSVQSTENGAGVTQLGSTSSTDDMNSRVSQHTVDTHVRIDSLKLFKVSTLSSTLARGQSPGKPFDPIFEVPVLGYLVKWPRKPEVMYAQSLVFVDAGLVPTAADLGNGVPAMKDQMEVALGRYQMAQKLTDLPNQLGDRILQYHQQIVNCLNREYIGTDGAIHRWINGSEQGTCNPADFHLEGDNRADAVEQSAK